MDAYPKCPISKFWDGYDGQKNVVIDEFRGDIRIAHLLRWFDPYPRNVEVKGSSVALAAERIWITTNLPPESWYPSESVDGETFSALRRRFSTCLRFTADGRVEDYDVEEWPTRVATSNAFLNQ